tara:strand:- start:173 stop:1273 length:1101 start_codon:yes stop_codon:yes gene_type:complete
MKKRIFLFLVNIIILIFLIKILDYTFVSNFLSGVNYVSNDYKLKIRTYKENLNVLYDNAANNKKISLNTDDNGYISLNKESQNLITNNDIFFVGGSTTANIGIESIFRFPYLFQKNVDSLNYQVYNSGVSGNHSFHSNIILISKILKRNPRPKFIFLHHNVNDLSQLIRTQSYWVDYNERGILEDHKKRRFDNLVLNSLFNIKELLFPNIYKLVMSSFINRNDLSINNNIDLKPTDLDEEIILSEFRKSIELFVKICQTYDIVPILISQYSRYNLNDYAITQTHANNRARYELICRLHPLFNDLIKDISIEMKVHFIDLSDQISNTDEFIYDEVHLSKKGNILAAKLISDYFYYNIHKSKLSENIQ